MNTNLYCKERSCNMLNAFATGIGNKLLYQPGMKLFSVFIIAIMILAACTKPGEPGSGSTLHVKVTYQKDFGTEVDTAVRHVDVGAKVFLHQHTDPVTDVVSYNFDGTLNLKNGTKKNFDAFVTIPESGQVSFTGLGAQRAAVLVLSKYYPGQGRLTSTALGNGEINPKLMNLNFYPDTWPK